MRALHYEDRLYFKTDEPEPAPGLHEAVIALRLAGICHTDLELTRGYRGFRGILGHEFVGEILHDIPGFSAKTRVVGEINIACGKCEYCLAGIPSQCIDNRLCLGIVNYPGVFADRLRLPIANLHIVPESVPDDAAVFTEPLAAALQVTALAPIRPTDRVILIGAGKLGLLIAQVLHKTGCDLTVIARQDKPVALLKKWGIKYVDVRRPDHKMPSRQSAHVVVDSTGSADGFALGLDLIRPRGTIVLKSTYAGLPQADLTRVVVDEIKIVGSRCGPFDAALRMMDSGQIDVQSMIEQIYPLEDAITAFEHAARPGVLKILLRP